MISIVLCTSSFASERASDVNINDADNLRNVLLNFPEKDANAVLDRMWHEGYPATSEYNWKLMETMTELAKHDYEIFARMGYGLYLDHLWTRKFGHEPGTPSSVGFHLHSTYLKNLVISSPEDLKRVLEWNGAAYDPEARYERDMNERQKAGVGIELATAEIIEKSVKAHPEIFEWAEATPVQSRINFSHRRKKLIADLIAKNPKPTEKQVARVFQEVALDLQRTITEHRYYAPTRDEAIADYYTFMHRYEFYVGSQATLNLAISLARTRSENLARLSRYIISSQHRGGEISETRLPQYAEAVASLGIQDPEWALEQFRQVSERPDLHDLGHETRAMVIRQIQRLANRVESKKLKSILLHDVARIPSRTNRQIRRIPLVGESLANFCAATMAGFRQLPLNY